MELVSEYTIIETRRGYRSQYTIWRWGHLNQKNCIFFWEGSSAGGKASFVVACTTAKFLPRSFRRKLKPTEGQCSRKTRAKMPGRKEIPHWSRTEQEEQHISLLFAALFIMRKNKHWRRWTFPLCYCPAFHRTVLWAHLFKMLQYFQVTLVYFWWLQVTWHALSSQSKSRNTFAVTTNNSRSQSALNIFLKTAKSLKAYAKFETAFKHWVWVHKLQRRAHRSNAKVLSQHLKEFF